MPAIITETIDTARVKSSVGCMTIRMQRAGAALETLRRESAESPQKSRLSASCVNRSQCGESTSDQGIQPDPTVAIDRQ